jgi:hypothetical protein
VLVCCDSGDDCWILADGLRGLGGGGPLEGDDEVDESPEGLRSPSGFLGGTGTDLALASEESDARWCTLSTLLSVFTRRRAGSESGSSLGDRSMRFCTGGGDVGGSDLRGGS